MDALRVALCSLESLAIIADMDTDALVERYLNHVRVEAGLSRNTIEAYRRDLQKFQRYLRQRNIAQLRRVTTDTIRSFLSSLHALKLSPVSSARCLSAVRGWLRFLLEQLVIGRSNQGIARELAISPRTVEIHRARVMEKMGAASLSQLVRMAFAAGIDPGAT